MPMPQPGEKAPEFEVTTHTGTTARLSDYAGKHVLLWFYPKADTPGWTIEGKGFRDRIREFESANAVILGVSFDGEAENRAFAEKFSFPFPLLCDTDRAIGLAYGACDDARAEYARRISFLIGPDRTIVKTYAAVKPANHPGEVLEDLASLSE